MQYTFSILYFVWYTDLRFFNNKMSHITHYFMKISDIYIKLNSYSLFMQLFKLLFICNYRLNLLPDISLKKTRTPNISRARPKMTNLAATNRNTHSKLNTRTDNVNAEKIEPSQIGPQVVSSSSLAITSPSLIVNSPSQYKRQTQTHMDSSNR